MDTHYSFLNKKFQAYVEDENDKQIDYDIVKALGFNVGISGTTAVLVDADNIFGKRSSEKINFKIRTGARETHEVCWRKDLEEVTKSSNASIIEIIPLVKLQRYENNYLFVLFFNRIKSVKPSIWLKEIAENE